MFRARACGVDVVRRRSMFSSGIRSERGVVVDASGVGVDFVSHSCIDSRTLFLSAWRCKVTDVEGAALQSWKEITPALRLATQVRFRGYGRDRGVAGSIGHLRVGLLVLPFADDAVDVP